MHHTLLKRAWPHPNAADQGSMRQVDLELEHRPSGTGPVAAEPAGPPAAAGGGAAGDGGASSDDYDGEEEDSEEEESDGEEDAAASGSDHEFGWVGCRGLGWAGCCVRTAVPCCAWPQALQQP